LLLGLGARAQTPANDDPCGAVTLTANGPLCVSPTLSTNVGATTTPPNGYTSPSGCGTAAQPKDVWFKFTTSATGPSSFGAAITVTGNPAGIVRLFRAASCSGPFTDLDCAAATTPNTVAPRLTTGSLAPNTTYYIQVAGSTSTDTPGPFTICLTDGPATPTCGRPVVGPFASTGLNTGTLAVTGGLNNAAPYAVVIQNNTAQNQFGTFSVTTSPLTLTGLTPGSSYTATVTASCPSGGQNTATHTFIVPIPNDEPCGAVALPLNGNVCTPVVASNNGASLSAAANALNGCGGPPTSRYDVWFTVTTAASGPGSTSFYLSVTGAAQRLILAQAPSCSGSFSQLACSMNASSAGGPAPVLSATGLTPNTTYYVLVDEKGFFGNGTPGPFTICAAAVPPCPGLDLAPVVTNLTSTSATVLFNRPSGSTVPTDYTITYTPQGGQPASLTAPSSPVQLTGLLPGTTYSVCVAGNCPGGGQAPPVCTSFTTQVACPAPTGLTVTNITPTTAQLNFSGPASGTGYTVTLTPQGGPSTTLTASGSPVQLTGLTPGTSYALSVVVSCGAGLTSQPATVVFSSSALCPAVTGLTVTASGSTGATVRFTGPANATGYQITYAPTSGGTPLTVTATASPVSISGLTSAETYTVSVTTSCTGGLTSQPASVVFTLLQYCTTLGGNCLGGSIAGVAIPGTTLSNLNSGCTSTGGNAYSVYPGAGNTTATLLRGQTYQYSITNPQGNVDIMAWIDFDRNGQFDATEGTQVALNAAAGTATASFTVPATAQLGATGLRVRTRAAGAGLGPGDACTQVGLGETEDYVVTIDLTTAAPARALAAQVEVYPNPAHQSLRLRLPAPLSRQPVRATLLNALGQPVQQHRFAAASTGLQVQLDVSRLPKGIYTLHLTTAAGVATKRIVVE
jgi:hypothetical protein